MVMEELWKPAAGWEGFYEVSTLGRARSVDRLARHAKGGHQRIKGKILKDCYHDFGYVLWGFSANGNQRAVYAHIVMLETFVGKRPNGMQACHNDGNPKNCRLDNLRWDTVQANNDDKKIHGTTKRGEQNHGAKLTSEDVLHIRQAKGTCREISKNYGIHPDTVSLIKTKRRWSWL
jgi:hypothetical protein